MNPGYIVESWDPREPEPDMQHFESDAAAKEHTQSQLTQGRMVRVFAVVEVYRCTGTRAVKASESMRATLAKEVALQVAGRDNSTTEA